MPGSEMTLKYKYPLHILLQIIPLFCLSTLEMLVSYQFGWFSIAEGVSIQLTLGSLLVLIPFQGARLIHKFVGLLGGACILIVPHMLFANLNTWYPLIVTCLVYLSSGAVYFSTFPSSRFAFAKSWAIVLFILFVCGFALPYLLSDIGALRADRVWSMQRFSGIVSSGDKANRALLWDTARETDLDAPLMVWVDFSEGRLSAPLRGDEIGVPRALRDEVLWSIHIGKKEVVTSRVLDNDIQTFRRKSMPEFGRSLGEAMLNERGDFFCIDEGCVVLDDTGEAIRHCMDAWTASTAFLGFHEPESLAVFYDFALGALRIRDCHTDTESIAPLPQDLAKKIDYAHQDPTLQRTIIIKEGIVRSFFWHEGSDMRVVEHALRLPNGAVKNLHVLPDSKLIYTAEDGALWMGDLEEPRSKRISEPYARVLDFAVSLDTRTIYWIANAVSGSHIYLRAF